MPRRKHTNPTVDPSRSAVRANGTQDTGGNRVARKILRARRHSLNWNSGS
jgi:hypothetical protein